MCFCRWFLSKKSVETTASYGTLDDSKSTRSWSELDLTIHQVVSIYRLPLWDDCFFSFSSSLFLISSWFLFFLSALFFFFHFYSSFLHLYGINIFFAVGLCVHQQVTVFSKNAELAQFWPQSFFHTELLRTYNTE